MTDDILAEPTERLARAQTRVRRISWWAMIAGVVIVAIVGAYAVHVTDELTGLREAAVRLEVASARERCDNALTADYLVAIARGLAADTATERTAGVTDIRRAAARVADADVVCADGVPAPLVPTPIEE